ncbi:MAG: hypothetical protein AB9891_04540 [Anaerolineaceae bacterium]
MEKGAYIDIDRIQKKIEWNRRNYQQSKIIIISLLFGGTFILFFWIGQGFLHEVNSYPDALLIGFPFIANSIGWVFANSPIYRKISREMDLSPRNEVSTQIIEDYEQSLHAAYNQKRKEKFVFFAITFQVLFMEMITFIVLNPMFHFGK